jgi:hypothetical protein
LPNLLPIKTKKTPKINRFQRFLVLKAGLEPARALLLTGF